MINRTLFREKVIRNTLLYTIGAVPLKLFLRLLLNRRFPLRNVIRGLLLLPWVVPTSLSMNVFLWLFEPTLLFSVVRTFAEMEIVWILTSGGPFNSTHMIGTYAYQLAIKNARIGEGAAVSLFFFPAMVLVVWFQLWYLQRRNK